MVDGERTVVKGKILKFGLATADGFLLTPAIPINATDQEAVYTAVAGAGMTSEASFSDDGVVMVPIKSEICGNDESRLNNEIEIQIEDGEVKKTIRVKPTCLQFFYLFKGECVSGRCFRTWNEYTCWKLKREGYIQ